MRRGISPCAGTHPNIWTRKAFVRKEETYPVPEGVLATICNGCDFRDECLDLALEMPEEQLRFTFRAGLDSSRLIELRRFYLNSDHWWRDDTVFEEVAMSL